MASDEADPVTVIVGGERSYFEIYAGDIQTIAGRNRQRDEPSPATIATVLKMVCTAANNDANKDGGPQLPAPFNILGDFWWHHFDSPGKYKGDSDWLVNSHPNSQCRGRPRDISAEPRAVSVYITVRRALGSTLEFSFC